MWGVSETHLTGPGTRKFREELRYQAPGYQFRAGHPVPFKTAGTHAIGGKSKGVGFLTTAPSRLAARNEQWPGWAEARTVSCSFLLGQRWVHGGQAYGYAYAAATKTVQAQTEDLLHTLHQQVVEGCVGPRFLMGDWNQLRGDMEAPKKWESLGWVEAQVFAKQTWQRDVQPTCKRKTVKDFIYLSPELLPFVRSVHTDDSYFADHALLWVELASLGLPQPLPIWRMPRPLPAHLKVPATQEVPCHADTTAQYRAIWQSFERRVEAIQAAKQEPVAPTQLGRAQTTEVCWITTELAPPTKGSSNATKPTFDGRNLRWLRQVRRLDSLSHLYESPKPWESIVADATAVWHSILASPGFPPRFATWISHRIDAYAKAELQESHQELYSLRSHLPSAQGLQKLRAAMLLELRHLEMTLLADRIQLAKANRRDNPARIFGDLRPERHESVSTVVAPTKATVIEIRPDKMEITFEPSDAFDHSAPLFCDGRMLELTALGEGVATLQHSLPEAGATVTQDRLHASPTEIFRAFEAEWEKRWDRHRHYSDERWQPFIDWYQAHVPAATSQMPLPAITLSEWKSAVRGKKSRSATGSDGISKHDLLALPDDLTQSLLDLIRAVELGESWPDASHGNRHS